MSLDTGARLGPYEVLAPIGAGGMGEVYRARDTRLDRLVALKILPDEIKTDPSRLRRFQTEARAAAALSHPNIVAVYDIGETGGVSYIVSELVEGQTLASRLGGKPIPLSELLELAIPIAEALARAHARGIVHRDLKPSNILLSAEGQPKITDFGLARFDLHAAGDDSRHATFPDDRTRKGTILGTAPYMSPEQARGDPADSRSDQFSFGVILYELATGTRPFDRDSQVQTLAAVLDQEPSWGSAFPEGLKPIVQRCLAKDPGKRYAATADLAHDLRALLDQTRTGARTSPRYGLLLGGLAALVIVVIGAVWIWMTSFASRGPTSLAVLPFRNLGADASLAHFGLGLADSIISRLSGIEAITVRPTSAIARYAVQDVDAAEVGRRLRVANVLEGTFQKVPGAMRVTAQLTDVSSEALVWSKQVDVPEGELFKIQDTTSVRIVEALRLRVTPEEKRRLTAATKVSDEATTEYLKVRATVIDINRVSRDERLEEVRRLDRILEQEPGYARALGTRAFIQAILNFFDPSSQWHERALADAERALALNPDLAEPLLARAQVLSSSTGGWKLFEAIEELKRAVKKAPGDDLSRLTLARMYRHAGWMDESRAEVDAAEQINPDTREIPRIHALALLDEGHCREAIGAFRRTPTLQGDVLPIWQFEALARLRCGEIEPVHTELAQRLASLSPDAPERALGAALLAIARQRAGKAGVHELEQEALSVDQRVGHFHHALFALADVHALAGNKTQAIDYLRRTAETGMPCIACFEKDSLLGELRNSPEFRSLIDELRAREAPHRAAPQ